MHLITAVIQPGKLEPVKTALAGMGVSGMTISSASGIGRQRGHVESYRGAEYRVDSVEKVRLEVLANDEDVEWLVNEIVAAAHTGRTGDGKVWVVPVSQVIRVSTGERGPAAV
jgi:nitrogen regulatory protein P-II 1